jgi:hypothetical protein
MRSVKKMCEVARERRREGEYRANVGVQYLASHRDTERLRTEHGPSHELHERSIDGQCQLHRQVGRNHAEVHKCVLCYAVRQDLLKKIECVSISRY